MMSVYMCYMYRNTNRYRNILLGNLIHISEIGMGLILIMILQVLNLYLVIVSGHNYNRFNQVGTGAGPVEDCELRSMVTSIKEALVKEVLEKCLIKPNGE